MRQIGVDVAGAIGCGVSQWLAGSKNSEAGRKMDAHRQAPCCHTLRTMFFEERY
jgi:hypothetical protein